LSAASESVFTHAWFIVRAVDDRTVEARRLRSVQVKNEYSRPIAPERRRGPCCVKEGVMQEDLPWPDLAVLAGPGHVVWNKSRLRPVWTGARVSHRAAESRYRRWTSEIESFLQE
jgi:hypothetical protein